MQTDAEAEINDNGAVLTKDGKKMRLEFITDADTANITVSKLAPLPTGDVVYNDKNGNRLAIRLTVSGSVNITVKLTPYDLDGTSIEEYNTPLVTWKQSDISKVGLVSDSIYVDVQAKSIGAYSHPGRDDLMITGNKLLAAIAKDIRCRLLEVTEKHR